MGQVERLVTLAVVGALTVVAVVSIFSFSVIQFSGSGDNLQLDVEMKPGNFKANARVNGNGRQLLQGKEALSSNSERGRKK